MPREALCPDCSRWILVLPSGNLYPHRGDGFYKWCRGSIFKPKAEDVREALPPIDKLTLEEREEFNRHISGDSEAS